MLALLGLVLLGVLALLALGALAAVAWWIMRVVLGLLALLFLSALAGVLVGVSASLLGVPEAASIGVLAACITCVAIIWWGAHDTSKPPPNAKSSDGSGEPRMIDNGLEAARASALALAPTSARSLSLAFATFDRVLRASDAEPHDPTLFDHAILIRRRVPELVLQAERLSVGASDAQRRSYREAMVAALGVLGADLNQNGPTSRARMEDDFRTLLTRVGRRSGERSPEIPDRREPETSP